MQSLPILVKLENVSMVFDALGRAVEAGGISNFVYGPSGAKLAVMNGSNLNMARVPLPGGGAAVYNSSGLAYTLHADWLGNGRLASTTARTLYGADSYAPFGVAYDIAGTRVADFTGQFQDADASHSGGQFDFQQRELNPSRAAGGRPILRASQPQTPATPRAGIVTPMWAEPRCRRWTRWG